MNSSGNAYASSYLPTHRIKDKLATAPKYSPQRCIYRVPKLLRQTNEEAYTPVLVSIGPLHHNTNDRLRLMEGHKLNYLDSFLRASASNNMNLDSCLELIAAEITRIRDSYADPISEYLTDDNNFIEMVLTDSAFLIELIRRGSSEQIADDPIWGKPHLINEVLRDIMMAENQLPFFIIEDLFQAAAGADQLAPLVGKFLNRYFQNYDETGGNSYPLADNRCHLLDLLRSHFNPNIQSNNIQIPPEVTDRQEWMTGCLPATQLHEANVKFRVKESRSLFDINFETRTGKLNIPKLTVGGRTESVFRNLLAFEQCHYHHKNLYIIDYVYFLDRLINTPEDVEVLVEAGIIENLLGSNEDLSRLINTLCKNTYVYPHLYLYEETTKQLNTHSKKGWNRSKAVLKTKYFAHPWAFISVIYAVTLLFLTILQVYTGFKQLH